MKLKISYAECKAFHECLKKSNKVTSKTTKLLFTVLFLAAGGFAWGQTIGDVEYNSGTGDETDADVFVWDETNDRLGIGTNSPNQTLEIKGDSKHLYFNNTTNWGGDNGISFRETQGTKRFGFWFPSGAMESRISNRGVHGIVQIEANTFTGGAAGAKIVARFEDDEITFFGTETGKVGINTSAPNALLDVRGDAIFNDDMSDKDFRIESDGLDDIFFVDASANAIGIGTRTAGDLNDGYILNVDGKVRCEELKVYLQSNWGDYVFEEDYQLKPLEEVETYIKENHHLPEVPKAEELEENGMHVSEMLTLQMKKIEELTLYIIEQGKRIELLEQQLAK